MGEVTCCCCIPIRAGVFILAVLGLIGGGQLIYQGVTIFAIGPDSDPTVIELRKHNETAPFADEYVSVAIPLAVYHIVNGVFGIILAVVLLKGASDRNARHLKLWVKVNYVLLGISAALIIAISIAFMSLIPKAGIMIGVMTLIIGAITLALTAYYIWVVNKYSGIVEEEQNQRRDNGKA